MVTSYYTSGIAHPCFPLALRMAGHDDTADSAMILLSYMFINNKTKKDQLSKLKIFPNQIDNISLTLWFD